MYLLSRCPVYRCFAVSRCTVVVVSRCLVLPMYLARSCSGALGLSDPSIAPSSRAACPITGSTISGLRVICFIFTNASQMLCIGCSIHLWPRVKGASVRLEYLNSRNMLASTSCMISRISCVNTVSGGGGVLAVRDGLTFGRPTRGTPRLPNEVIMASQSSCMCSVCKKKSTWLHGRPHDFSISML